MQIHLVQYKNIFYLKNAIVGVELYILQGTGTKIRNILFNFNKNYKKVLISYLIQRLTLDYSVDQAGAATRFVFWSVSSVLIQYIVGHQKLPQAPSNCDKGTKFRPCLSDQNTTKCMSIYGGPGIVKWFVGAQKCS